MPANHVLLQRITLTATASSVTFNNLDTLTGYTDLVIKASARSTHSSVLDEMIIRFNSSSTGYSNRFIMGDGATAASYSNNYTTSGYIGYICANNATSSTFGNTDIYIPNYRGSQNKSLSSDSVAETNATTQYMNMSATLLSNTAAIASLQLLLGYGSFVAGSSFSLYGVANAATTPVLAPKADGGDIIETDGTYWYHAFTGSGTFKPQVNLTCDTLVVAGGGGGGDYGGGGAGGFRTASLSLSSTSYTVTVGAGGSGGSRGSNGGDSTISTITSSGGGGGGPAPGSGDANGANGGSGGGAGVLGTTNNGGTGNTPSTSPSQGNNGGNGTSSANYGGGGGGGAGAAGGNGTTSKGGDGGNGTYTSLTDAIGAATGLGQLVSSHYYFAGGAGGSAWMGATSGTSLGGAGGYGGGGAGRGKDAGTANAGTPNTGGGGSGLGVGGSGGGPAGGSGVVVIRYPVA